MKALIFLAILSLFSISLIAQQQTIYKKPTHPKAFEGSYSTGKNTTIEYGNNYLGFWFGMGGNRLIINDINDSLSFQNPSSPSFGGGLILEYEIAPKLAFRFMPSFSRQSYTVEYQNFNQPDTNNIQRLSQNFFSLEIPILLLLKAKLRNSWRGYLSTGLRSEVALSQSQIGENNLNLNFSNINISWEYGVGIEKNLGRNAPIFKRIGAELRFSMGFTDILPKPNQRSLIADSVFVQQWRVFIFFIFNQ